MRYAIWTAVIILTPVAYKGAQKVKSSILTHDRYMLEMSVEDRKTAYYEALRGCLKKHFLNVCKEIK